VTQKPRTPEESKTARNTKFGRVLWKIEFFVVVQVKIYCLLILQGGGDFCGLRENLFGISIKLIHPRRKRKFFFQGLLGNQKKHGGYKGFYIVSASWTYGLNFHETCKNYEIAKNCLCKS
jgi:hypothetical protein